MRLPVQRGVAFTLSIFLVALNLPRQNLVSYSFPSIQTEQKKGAIYLTSFCSFCSTAILSACQYVGSTAPTVLPIRKAPLVLVYDPLDNHEIAFGVIHFALRRFPRWCARLTGSVLPTHARARMASLVASPLCQRRFFRRKFVHPSASVRPMV